MRWELGREGLLQEKIGREKKKTSRCTVMSLVWEDTAMGKGIAILCGSSDRVTAPGGLSREGTRCSKLRW